MTKLNSTIMHDKNSKSTKAKYFAAKVISSSLGDSHFLLKSAADTVAHLEAKMVSKLTGIDYDHVIEDRHNETEDTQEKFKKLSKNLQDKLKRKGKPAQNKQTDEVYNLIINS